jgi:hypothetical protein
MYRFPWLLVALLLVCPLGATAQTRHIDFETLPDGSVPTDDMLIGNQYGVYGLTFELLGAGPGQTGPRIAKVGYPKTAFDGAGGPDQPRNDTQDQVGQYFLTDDGVHDSNECGLRITYTVPVRRAYGELLDVDNNELWSVKALDAYGAVIAQDTISKYDQGGGNGGAVPWQFDLDQDIHQIELIPWGTGSSYRFGLAFDNFRPSSTPGVPECAIVGPDQGEVGQTLTFDGSGSSDEDGSIVAHHWDFGDGQSGHGQVVNHAFAAPGTYQVTLTVVDDDGNETSGVHEPACVQTVTIRDAYGPPPTEVRGIAPNPFVRARGHEYVSFRDPLFAGATVAIYDVAGTRVQQFQVPEGQERFDWNVTSAAGEQLASGIYIYVIQPVTGQTIRGKLAVIR